MTLSPVREDSAAHSATETGYYYSNIDRRVAHVPFAVMFFIVITLFYMKILQRCLLTLKL